MADLTLPVPGEAGVIADVLVLDRRESELGAVVEYPDVSAIRLDGIRVLVPKELWRWGTLSLAVEYYRIAQIHVNHIFWRDAESWWRCEQSEFKQLLILIRYYVMPMSFHMSHSILYNRDVNSKERLARICPYICRIDRVPLDTITLARNYSTFTALSSIANYFHDSHALYLYDAFEFRDGLS